MRLAPQIPPELDGTEWYFPLVDSDDPEALVGVGADLYPATLLYAYRRGLFPMPIGRGRQLGWFSPSPRGILPLDGLVVSRSLRRSQRRFEVRYNTKFEQVMRACGDPRRPDGWINDKIVQAYVRLHELGFAQSVECFVDDVLVGGLYGVSIGGFFAGESMFHHATDASKVALVSLVEELRRLNFQLLDVQWATAHLRTFGVIEISRSEYLERLAAAVGSTSFQSESDASDDDHAN